jgi:hypothetical protein
MDVAIFSSPASSLLAVHVTHARCDRDGGGRSISWERTKHCRVVAGRGVAPAGGLDGAVVLDVRDLVAIGAWGRGGRRQGGSMFRGRSSENR